MKVSLNRHTSNMFDNILVDHFDRYVSKDLSTIKIVVLILINVHTVKEIRTEFSFASIMFVSLYSGLKEDLSDSFYRCLVTSIELYSVEC